jgi:hypothetical protein
MNPNDKIRLQILQYFYDRNRNATSRTGKKGSAVKISDVKRELKARYGLSQQGVMSNLTYLIDNQWVKIFEIEKTVTVRGGTVPSTTTFYEITAAGIDKIEGGSQFEPRERYPGINISATGQNVITLGDGNIVHAEYSELRGYLDELKDAITSSPTLSEAEKLDYAVDVESIKDQLAKPKPNKSVVQQLWSGLEKILSRIAGIAEAIARVAPYIERILT